MWDLPIHITKCKYKILGAKLVFRVVMLLKISEWTKATHVAHHSWKALEHTFINTDPGS